MSLRNLVSLAQWIRMSFKKRRNINQWSEKNYKRSKTSDVDLTDLRSKNNQIRSVEGVIKLPSTRVQFQIIGQMQRLLNYHESHPGIPDHRSGSMSFKKRLLVYGSVYKWQKLERLETFKLYALVVSSYASNFFYPRMYREMKVWHFWEEKNDAY